MEKQPVGYIGLGHAGYFMAACLARQGHKLIVHDADLALAAKFVEQYPHCEAAATSGSLRPEAFRPCSIVITMLPHGKVVRDVLLGDDGIASVLRAGMLPRLRVGPPM